MFDEENVIADPDLNQLYESFVAENEDIILNHRVIDESSIGLVQFEIATPGLRSQLVYAVLIVVDGEKWLSISSTVGELMDTGQAWAALKAANNIPSVALSLDDDDLLTISVLRKLKLFDSDEFRRALLTIATYSDTLEETIFGTDKN